MFFFFFLFYILEILSFLLTTTTITALLSIFFQPQRIYRQMICHIESRRMPQHSIIREILYWISLYSLLKIHIIKNQVETSNQTNVWNEEFTYLVVNQHHLNKTLSKFYFSPPSLFLFVSLHPSLSLSSTIKKGQWKYKIKCKKDGMNLK